MKDEMHLIFRMEVKCHQVFSLITKRRCIPFDLLSNIAIDPSNNLSNRLYFCFERMIEFVQKLIYFCCLVLSLAHRLCSGSFLGDLLVCLLIIARGKAENFSDLALLTDGSVKGAASITRSVSEPWHNHPYSDKQTPLELT